MIKLMLALSFLFTSSFAFSDPKILHKNIRHHSVVTADGIKLNLIELVNANGQPMTGSNPVLLMHGYAESWNAWYLLADDYRKAGLRVFIANWRGHGQGIHRSMPVTTNLGGNDPRLTFHNFAPYDVSALVDFVYSTAGNKKLVYQSHSMGGMMAHLAFAGVTIENNKFVISEKSALRYEKKVAAFLPIAAPLSMKSKEFPGSSIMDMWAQYTGVNSDFSDRPETALGDARIAANYNYQRMTGLTRGLMNLEHMTLEEYTKMTRYHFSNVPRPHSDVMFEMKKKGYKSPDGNVDYEKISKWDASTNFHRTNIPTLIMTASTDSLALPADQDQLAIIRNIPQVRYEGHGHMDITASEVGAKKVVRDTLRFIEEAYQGRF